VEPVVDEYNLQWQGTRYSGLWNIEHEFNICDGGGGGGGGGP
jgi:hypothetical protein